MARNGARYNVHTYKNVHNYEAEGAPGEARAGELSQAKPAQARYWCVIDLVSPYGARSASAQGFTRICRPAAEDEHAAVTALKLATELYGAEVIVNHEASRTKAIVQPQAVGEESRANCVRVRLVTLEDSKGTLRQRLAALAQRDDPHAVKDRQITALQEENAVLLAQLKKAMEGMNPGPKPAAKPAPWWRSWLALGRKRVTPHPWLED